MDKLKVLSTYGIYPDIKGANISASYPDFEVLKWLSSLNPPILPNTEGANLACKSFNPDVIEWLISRNPPIFPDSKGAKGLIEVTPNNQRYSNGMKNLFSDFSPEDPDIWFVRKVEVEKIRLLKILAKNGITPDAEGANSALTKGYFDIFSWLTIRKIYPNQKAADICVHDGNIKGLMILEDFDIHPNPSNIEEALQNQDIGMLKYLANVGIYPSKENINDRIARYISDELIVWLEKEGLYSDDILLEWLKKEGLPYKNDK